GRIKGETYRLAFQDEAARREFVTAYLRGERDPQLLASLGLMARQRDDSTRARTYLEAVMATKDPVPRPRAYLELARLRAVTYAAKTGLRPYDMEQTVGLLTPLFVAQRQPQQLLDIYLEIARVWENSAVVPDRGNLGALEFGLRLFPRSGELALRTAALLIKHGYKADAAALIDRTLNATRDPELKAKLELLRPKVAGEPAARPGLAVRFSPEANLGPELRQRLAEHRAAKTAALTELRAQLAATEKFAPEKREAALAAFAAVQTPRLRTLEHEAVRLETDLGWPPDEGDDYAPGLTDFSPDTRPEARDQLRLYYAALQRPQGLSPPQSSLLREMILEAQNGAAPRGAFLFFAPATARVRFPAGLPAALAGDIAEFTKEKEALKTELRNALVDAAGSASDVVRMIGFGALAEQQAPRFTALGARAEAIRRALGQLPARPVPGTAPALPAALAARLTAYQNQRSELQQNSRRDLRALRSGLPATGVDLVASGDPPRLTLQIAGELTPELAAKRSAVDAFNRAYAERAAALNRELAELRRLLADTVPPGSAHGKSVSDLMQDFTTAALRQASAETYRDCRAAVFQPGLSPEQRRLLFGRTAEKQPSLVFEF
ncbi:MAG: hypothetical protein NTV51_19455, partial [Verrucomicrobia bacterium]|nr:hypothetical protein [Verrucomicrobiota bacterium]